MDVITESISWLGVISLGAGGILQLVSRHLSLRAAFLDQATSVDNLADVSKLDALLPLLVAVRGIVQSHDAKPCELSDKLAVLREMVEEEIYRKERDSGRVVQEPFEVRRVLEQADWFLTDMVRHPGGGGPSGLPVEGSHDAAGLRDCLVTTQVFVPEEATRTTMMKAVLDRAIKNMIKYGVRRTEKFLPVGSVVTVVGELYRDPLRAAKIKASATAGAAASSGSDAGGGRASSGASAGPSGGGPASSVVAAATGTVLPYVVRRPAAGPYYITPQTLTQLRASVTNMARILRYCAWGLGAVGAALIVRKVVLRLWQARQQSSFKRRLAEAQATREQRRWQQQQAEQGRGAGTSGGIRPSASCGGGEADRSPNTCVVCLDADVDMVFTSCGHMCVCAGCGHQMRRCPICRTSSPSIRVYKP